MIEERRDTNEAEQDVLSLHDLHIHSCPRQRLRHSFEPISHKYENLVQIYVGI